jgi:CheY-like chemotaxis protein
MARIVLIEDDQKSADLVVKILTPHGHEILHADHGIAGLTLIQESHPDLVLLDLDLPDLDGKAIANRIRNIPALKQLPIIAVTANTSPIAQRMAISFGCNALITKPIDTRRFPIEIKSFLSSEHEE